MKEKFSLNELININKLASENEKKEFDNKRIANRERLVKVAQTKDTEILSRNRVISEEERNNILEARRKKQNDVIKTSELNVALKYGDYEYAKKILDEYNQDSIPLSLKQSFENTVKKLIKTKKGRELYVLYNYFLSSEKHEFSTESTIIKKIKQITDPEFKNYAIRFMNIKEYAQMLDSKKIQPREVWTEKPVIFTGHGWVLDSEQYSKEYLELVDISFIDQLSFYSKIFNGKDYGWDELADIKTMWEISTNTLMESKMLMRKYIEIHTNVKKNKLDSRSLLVRAREKMIEYLKVRLEKTDLKKVAVKYYENPNSYFSDEEEKLIEIIGSDNIKIINVFLKNSNEFTDKINFRKIMKIFSLYLRENAGLQTQQYHLAVIFNEDVVGPWNSKYDNRSMSMGSYGTSYWARLKESDGDDAANSVMGVIVCFSNKDVVSDVVDMSYKSGNFAHPVFDTHGNIQLPNANHIAKEIVNEI